jgi:ComF family protein
MLSLLANRHFRHWPSQCGVCRQWASQLLCPACVARFATPSTRCIRCGLRLGLANSVCGTCLRAPPAFASTCCAVEYGFPWDHVITSFKFEDRLDWAPALADLLHQALPANPEVDLVMPIPLSAQRLAERGYNQAWEVARRIARRRRLPARQDCLLRPWDTAHQADLGRRERQLNLRRAFMVDSRHRHLLQGKRIALVDDVMTTGTTAQEASSALLRAGAHSVHMWVLARTEGP